MELSKEEKQDAEFEPPNVPEEPMIPLSAIRSIIAKLREHHPYPKHVFVDEGAAARIGYNLAIYEFEDWLRVLLAGQEDTGH